MLSSNIYFTVLLALCVAAWLCNAEELSIITHEMIFSPKLWDYWYGKKNGEGHLAVGDYLYQILKFGTDGKTLELQPLEDPSSTYFVLAVSTISVKDGIPYIQWNVTCHRHPKTKVGFHLTNFDVHYIVVDSKDKEIQFQCPNRKKKRINISLKPIKQGKAWTPKRGKIKLLNLRTQPFEGYRLYFPKTIEWAYYPNSKLMKNLITTFILEFITSSELSKTEMTQACLTLEFFRRQIGDVYDTEDKWVAYTIRQLRHIPPQLLNGCPKEVTSKWPSITDFLEGRAHSRFRLTDPFIFIGTGAKNNIELGEVSIYSAGGSKMIAVCQLDESRQSLIWHCNDEEHQNLKGVVKWLLVPATDQRSTHCHKNAGQLEITLGGQSAEGAPVRQLLHDVLLTHRSVWAIKFIVLDRKDKTCDMWKAWSWSLRSSLNYRGFGHSRTDYRDCPIDCGSIVSIMELMGGDRGAKWDQLQAACADDIETVTSVNTALNGVGVPNVFLDYAYRKCNCGVGQFMDTATHL